MCQNGAHTFKGKPEFEMVCECGEVKMERSSVLDKKGNPMARIVSTGVMSSSLDAVLGRAFEKQYGRKIHTA